MTKKNLFILRSAAALFMAIFSIHAAMAQDAVPQVTGFTSLQVNPPCMIVGTSQDAQRVQTLWVENACEADVTFDKIDNSFAQGAHEAGGTEVVFGWRRPEGMRPESKSYYIAFDADGSACRSEEFLKTETEENQQRAKCKSLTLAAGHSIGFRPYAPARLDWRGGAGAFIQGEMLQE